MLDIVLILTTFSCIPLGWGWIWPKQFYLRFATMGLLSILSAFLYFLKKDCAFYVWIWLFVGGIAILRILPGVFLGKLTKELAELKDELVRQKEKIKNMINRLGK